MKVGISDSLPNYQVVFMCECVCVCLCVCMCVQSSKYYCWLLRDKHTNNTHKNDRAPYYYIKHLIFTCFGIWCVKFACPKIFYWSFLVDFIQWLQFAQLKVSHEACDQLENLVMHIIDCKEHNMHCAMKLAKICIAQCLLYLVSIP